MRTYRPAIVTVLDRKPKGFDDMTACLLLLMTVGLFASLFGNVSMIDGIKAQQAKEERTLLCFNSDGDVTSNEDWKECRMVTIRESR